MHPPYTPGTPPVQTKRGFRRAFGASTRARSGADRGPFSAPENGWGRCPRRLAASPPEYFSKEEGSGGPDHLAEAVARRLEIRHVER